MAKYRQKLPQTSERLFLTDGGMETTLVFHDGIDLPCFAAFDLLKTKEGTAHARRYYERYITVANASGLGFILESPTWRASRDWGAKIGYSADALADMNRRAIALMTDLRDQYETPDAPMVISGNVGPRGDGYVVENAMSAKEAADYHGEQINIFANTEADMVSAFTMNYAEEAIGVAKAAKSADMPVVISFTLETNGRLPTGQTLKDAIAQTDAATGQAPAYYMINCAHPTHFADALAANEGWVKRLRGLRANASRRSHAELDQAKDLDIGDPVDLGQLYAELRRKLPHLTMLGGCCGTDHRHVAEISRSCVAIKPAA